MKLSHGIGCFCWAAIHVKTNLINIDMLNAIPAPTIPQYLIKIINRNILASPEIIVTSDKSEVSFE